MQLQLCLNAPLFGTHEDTPGKKADGRELELTGPGAQGSICACLRVSREPKRLSPGVSGTLRLSTGYAEPRAAS